MEGIKREYEKKLEIMKDKENLLKRSAAMEEKKDLRIMGSLRKTNTFIEGFKESMSAKKTILEGISSLIEISFFFNKFSRKREKTYN